MFSLCSLCSFLLSFSFGYLLRFSIFVDAQAENYDFPTATISTRWTNTWTTNHSEWYAESSIRPILLRGKGELPSPAYTSGFYRIDDGDKWLFAVFIVILDNESTSFSGNRQYISVGYPQVVWSANRNNPVNSDATLELTLEGDLVLKDADGTVAWSTNTSSKSVVGLNLSDLGNLMLFDKNNVTVWQSFDQPTDSLVHGQKLMVGQRLTPRVSDTNWTIDGMITLSMYSNGLFAQIEASPPQIFYEYLLWNGSDESAYVEFVNGSLAVFSSNMTLDAILIPQAFSAQFMKLFSDGHLRMYGWASGWKEVADLLTGYLGNCAYPKVCGQYGICSNGDCSCPTLGRKTSYFKQVDNRHTYLGCSENAPLSCGDSEYQSFVELANVTYFTFTTHLNRIDALGCKEACANNYSCKAAIFRYESDPIAGQCYLLTQVFSLIDIEKIEISYNSTVYLKVYRGSSRFPVIIASCLGALFATLIIIEVIVFFVQKRDDNEVEEDYLDQLPGMPTRYAYDDLKSITNDFSKKIGEGGFGSVFEGTLIDGTEVAVKCLRWFWEGQEILSCRN